VSIRFQNGDVAYPQWSGGSGQGERPSLEGVHRGSVISNIDPEGLGRLYVQVPGVTDGVWATPEQPPPTVGAEVSVSFEGGSADHPVWSR
jgi:type VI secretion system (T6SS) baseplate-like injector VgrG